MAHTEINPIPTEYAGHVFRSRTEARWAVFFDLIQLRWEYEPEGIILGDGTWYLPDFWMPDMALWVEVKPSGEVSDIVWEKAAGLLTASGHGVLVLNGAPWPRVYDQVVWEPAITEGEMRSSGRPLRYPYFWCDEYSHGRNSEPRLFSAGYDGEERDAAVQWEIVHAMQTARAIKLDCAIPAWKEAPQ